MLFLGYQLKMNGIRLKLNNIDLQHRIVEL